MSLFSKSDVLRKLRYGYENENNCHPQDCPTCGRMNILIDLCQVAQKDLQDEIDCQILLLLFFQYLKKLMVGKKMILSNNGFLQNAYFSQL